MPHLLCCSIVQHLGGLQVVVLHHQRFNVLHLQAIKLLRDLAQGIAPHRIAAGFGQPGTDKRRNTPDADGIHQIKENGLLIRVLDEGCGYFVLVDLLPPFPVVQLIEIGIAIGPVEYLADGIAIFMIRIF
ncbi:hypothetical protein D3C75_603830 [compost metagenome]